MRIENMRIENTELVKAIVMKPSVQCKCEIGQDWYTMDITIEFYPLQYYPEYIEVQEWISKNIDGEELNIEQALKLIFDYMKDVYEPAELQIVGNVNNVTTHFPVSVTLSTF